MNAETEDADYVDRAEWIMDGLRPRFELLDYLRARMDECGSWREVPAAAVPLAALALDISDVLHDLVRVIADSSQSRPAAA